MNKKLGQRWLVLIILASLADAAAYGLDTSQPAEQGKAAGAVPADAAQQGAGAPDKSGESNPPPRATGILGLCDDNGNEIDGMNTSQVGLYDVLWVVVKTTADPQLDQKAQAVQVAAWCKGAQPAAQVVAPKDLKPAVQLDASAYALFFDGREVPGLEDTVYNSAHHALGFLLTRNASNKPVWTLLLGSPTAAHTAVTVALGVREKDRTTQPTIEGNDTGATFQLEVFSWLWLWIAVAAVAVVLALVVGTAWRTTTLRDCLLPQLPASEQPYSLGRCQMAFWFVLIFASFIFLYVMLWDYNTVSPQALALMGISSATALAAVAVDILKDSPADMANRALQALGLNTHADVLRVQQEIDARKPQVPATQAKAQVARTAAEQAQAASDAIAVNPVASADQKATAAKTAKDAAGLADAADRAVTQLQAEIQDREIVIRTYEDKSGPFRGENFFKDITTDLNGPTVHRLQVVFWTVALGGVFLVGVYRDLAMPPDFSTTLLALIGLSGAGYVGFKYPEKNN
jgi:hypothetical protein